MPKKKPWEEFEDDKKPAKKEKKKGLLDRLSGMLKPCFFTF